jgi:predicted amidohydrolase YtcJ
VLVDVRCAAGVITHIGSAPSGADVVIDADGGALLPGLHDHHIHLLALAASRRSVTLGPPAVADPASFDAAVRGARPGADGWVRGVGFHESVAGPLDRDRLDALVPGAPVRVQHRTGAMWVLNTAALAMTGLADLDAPGVERDADGRATGRLYRLDEALRARLGVVDVDLADTGRELSSYGVTGVCDMTPTEDPADVDALAGAVADGTLPFDVVVSGGPGLPDPAGPGLRRGPVKFVLDDARLPSIDALVTGFAVARRAGRAIAVHCVTRAELVVALAAWDEVGAEPGDRVEHGAVIPVELVADLRSRGLVVVTQPSFVGARGDQYLADVDPGDIEHLWRCGSLVEAGVGVAAGTDAPFGDADPWRAIAAARDRTTPSGVVLGADEQITAERALAMFLTPLDDPAGTPRRVEVGAPADLCLLATPLPAALADPAATTVTATIHRGAIHG